MYSTLAYIKVRKERQSRQTETIYNLPHHDFSCVCISVPGAIEPCLTPCKDSLLIGDKTHASNCSDSSILKHLSYLVSHIEVVPSSLQSSHPLSGRVCAGVHGGGEGHGADQVGRHPLQDLCLPQLRPSEIPCYHLLSSWHVYMFCSQLRPSEVLCYCLFLDLRHVYLHVHVHVSFFNFL